MGTGAIGQEGGAASQPDWAQQSGLESMTGHVCACVSVCSAGYKQGINSIPLVKRDHLVLKETKRRRRGEEGGASRVSETPVQLAFSQATFFGFHKQISLEMLIKQGRVPWGRLG